MGEARGVEEGRERRDAGCEGWWGGGIYSVMRRLGGAIILYMNVNREGFRGMCVLVVLEVKKRKIIFQKCKNVPSKTFSPSQKHRRISKPINNPLPIKKHNPTSPQNQPRSNPTFKRLSQKKRSPHCRNQRLTS